MRITAIVAALLCFAFGAGVVSAQDAELERREPRRSYQVCDWGLLVIEHHPFTGASFIDITAPDNFSGVASAFTVSGEAYGIFENQFAVFVTTPDGTELFRGVAVVAADEMAGRGEWSLDVELGAVEPATRLVVHAFADSPADGSIMAEDILYLSGNSAFGLPYIDIEQPLSGDNVSIPLHITGTAGALFENSFVLEVTDASGAVLIETPVTFAAPDIGLSGAWSADLDFTVETPGQTLTVRAYALSMADGESIVAEDSARVTFGVMSLQHERVLVVQAGDPLTEDDDMCAATATEFDNTATVPVHVTAVTAIETRSMPPQVMLLIDGEKPSMCQMPLRLRVVRAGDSYTGDLYYSAADGEGICTRDLQFFTMSVPLGVQPSGTFSAAVNGVALSNE